MNIDERLEALTQSVELLAAMHRDNERNMTEHMAQMMDAIARLANIASIHDQRLDDLENR